MEMQSRCTLLRHSTAPHKGAAAHRFCSQRLSLSRGVQVTLTDCECIPGQAGNFDFTPGVASCTVCTYTYSVMLNLTPV